jgi:hypothetical protein
MATYDPDRPNVATGTGKVPTKKTKKPKSSKPKTPAKTDGYDWGDGRPVHTISIEQHNANKAGVQNYGVRPDTPLDAPLTSQTAYQMAQAAANREYAPQLNAVKQLQTSVPVWYQNYINQAGTSQQAAQQYAQPILGQAQAGVENAKTTAPGLDPSSPQYATEQQAAQGRSTMAQNSANYLAGVAAATNAYFGGQQNIAARDLPQVQAGLVQQYGQLASQREGAVTDEYGKIRTNEQNASIARSTLNLDTTKAAADVATDTAKIEQKDRDRRAKAKEKRETPNKYGIPDAQWKKWSSSHRQRVIDAANKKSAGKTQAEKDAEKAAKETEKKKTAIKKATSGIRTKVTDARSAWERYARARNPKTTPDPTTGDAVPVMDPKTKRPVMVGATPDQIKAQLHEDGYTETEIHVMLVLRGKKKLTPADVKRLKDQDPNIRIPREWLPGKTPGTPRPGNAPSGYGNQQRPT